MKLTFPYKGMDIKENYQNVLPLKMFPDGRVWANVGSGEKSRSHHIGDLKDIYTKKPQIIDYQAIDFTKYNYEVYLFERPFFNIPYTFITVVMEHKVNPVFEYIRPAGPYWEALKSKYNGTKDIKSIETNEKYYMFSLW